MLTTSRGMNTRTTQILSKLDDRIDINRCISGVRHRAPHIYKGSNKRIEKSVDFPCILLNNWALY